MIDKEILDEILPVPDIDELKDSIVEELSKNGFVITNFKAGGVFYTIMMIVVRIKIEITELLRTVLSSMFVSSAEGTWLDIKSADYAKKRKSAQKTQGIVTISRNDLQGEAIKIPKGQVFKTEKDINGEELRFVSIEAAVLQKNSMNTRVLVEAENAGSRYNVPKGQICRSLTYISGIEKIYNDDSWITQEGSDTEDDESFRNRTLRSWSERSAMSIEDTFINVAESVPGVLFAQADCDHPRGQGTIDIIITGTAGEATDGLLTEVKSSVDKITGPYDDVSVKSSVTSVQDISITVTVANDASSDDTIKTKVTTLLSELLAVKKGRKLNELRLSDANYYVRNGYTNATNVAITSPSQDVKLTKDKVVTLGSVVVTVQRE